MSETFLAILGLVAIASWIYSVVIISKKIKGTTPFENTVLIVGLVVLVAFIIGSLSN